MAKDIMVITLQDARFFEILWAGWAKRIKQQVGIYKRAMLLSNRIGIYRILSGTWKHLLFNILICVLTYLVYTSLIHENIEIPDLFPTVLGTALAFFIGFNNNQAYDRWWEARKIWGALVNDSRTWARQMVYFQAKSSEDVSNPIAKRMVYRHISFLYALKQRLRQSREDEYKKYLPSEDVGTVERESNKANAILTLQTRDLNELLASNAIDGFKFLELNKMLIHFCDSMGQSERIANTVFPTTYNFYTRVFIWFFIVLTTMDAVQPLGHWSIVAGVFIGYVFLTIHKIGKSLLHPFDDIPTGVPLNQITRTAEINVLETLKETDLPGPVESVRGLYVM